MVLKRVLYPGRFQPFHKGHLGVVKDLLKEYDEVVIVIGSAQEGFTCRNPFTAGERIEMIDETLHAEGYSRDQYWLIPVPDLNKPLAWTTYVLGMIPRVGVVVSGNPHVRMIYEWMGFKTLEPRLYDPSRYNGTRIRRIIACGGEWRDLVPSIVADYIIRVDGVERIKRVCGSGDCRDRR
jgi:nicotinamide-nucleotide adenylyltransferase